jgi:hypothetical protein
LWYPHLRVALSLDDIVCGKHEHLKVQNSVGNSANAKSAAGWNYYIGKNPAKA